MTRPEPDVTAVLRAVREQLARMNDDVRLLQVPPLQRIKDAIATVAPKAEPRTEVEALLKVLAERAASLAAEARVSDVGTVQRIGNGVATLSGLSGARTDELVTFPTGIRGMVLNLDHDRIDAILLGPDRGIQGGDLVTRTGRRLRVPVGRGLLGRVVSPLGEPLDRRGPVQEAEWRHLERDAPGIMERVPVDTPLHSGTKIVDALVPVGRGQRELIIGDRQTGKTTLAVDAVLSQKGQGVLCVYVAIAQKKSSSLEVIETLRRHDALPYCIVVVCSPDDPPALRYLAPYAGCTMAEFFMDEGGDALVVYDDLTKHADAYRELSLLLRRPPGREAYPGDVFYLHARLLERACRLAPDAGDGSLTALPIVETQSGNFAAYIPTNLIAITDGQIALDTDLFNRGIKPAVNVGLSVSRVGGAAQSEVMRELAGNLRLDLAQYEEVSQFARFGAELDETTRRQIQRGERLRAALTQAPNEPFSLAAQVVILLAVSQGILDDVPLPALATFEQGLKHYVETSEPGVWRDLERSGKLTGADRESLLTALESFGEQRSLAQAAQHREAEATADDASRSGE